MFSGVSRSTTPSANISPALGPPTSLSRIVTLNGYCGSSPTVTPMIARLRSSGAGAVCSVTVDSVPPDRMVKVTGSAGLCLLTAARRSLPDDTGAPSTAATTSPWCNRPSAGEPLARRVDHFTRYDGKPRVQPATHGAAQVQRAAGIRHRDGGQVQVAGHRIGLVPSDLDQRPAVHRTQRVVRRAGAQFDVRDRQQGPAGGQAESQQARQQQRAHPLGQPTKHVRSLRTWASGDRLTASAVRAPRLTAVSGYEAKKPISPSTRVGRSASLWPGSAAASAPTSAAAGRGPRTTISGADCARPGPISPATAAATGEASGSRRKAGRPSGPGKNTTCLLYTS